RAGTGLLDTMALSQRFGRRSRCRDTTGIYDRRDTGCPFLSGQPTFAPEGPGLYRFSCHNYQKLGRRGGAQELRSLPVSVPTSTRCAFQEGLQVPRPRMASDAVGVPAELARGL